MEDYSYFWQAAFTALLTILAGGIGLILNSLVQECLSFRRHIGEVGSTLFQNRALLENIRAIENGLDKERVERAKKVCANLKQSSAKTRMYLVSILGYRLYSGLGLLPPWSDALNAAEKLSLLSYVVDDRRQDGDQTAESIDTIFRLLKIERMYGK